MTFKRSNLPKNMEDFILGAEKVNPPDGGSGSHKEKESVQEPSNPPMTSLAFQTVEDPALEEFEKKPIRPFRKRTLASFREFESTRQIHQLQLRFTERDWEMLNYCMRIGEEKSKQQFIAQAVRVAMAELIRAQELD